VRTAIVLAAVTVALTAAPAAAKVNKADVAIQKQAVLRKTDLPAGWKSSPSQPVSPSDPSCARLKLLTDPATATSSPVFWKSDVVQANNSVVVLASAKQAMGWLAPYREPDAIACLEAEMKDAFAEPRFQGTRVYVTPVDDTPRGADDAVGFEVEITATTTPSAQQPAPTLVIVSDVLVVRVGRALSGFTFSNLADPLPEQGLLIDAVIGRLQDAGI